MIIGSFLFQLLASSLIEVNDDLTQKQMFEAKCSNCGKTATVPFKPTAGKPIYCRECFAKIRSKPKEHANIGFDDKQVWAKRRESGRTRMETEHSDLGKFTLAF